MMNSYRARRLRWMPLWVLGLVVTVVAGVAQGQTAVTDVSYDPVAVGSSQENSIIATISVGGFTVSASELAHGTSDDSTWDDLDVNSGNFGCCSGGSTTVFDDAGTFPAGGLIDTNGGDFDIFIFESASGDPIGSANDGDQDASDGIFATYSIGGSQQFVGVPISTTGGAPDWGLEATWTSTQPAGGAGVDAGQTGCAFALRISDLLDAGGNPLPSTAVIHSITVSDDGDVDLTTLAVHVVPGVLACGATVEHSGGSTEVSENGPTSDNYTLVLDSEPSGDVTVTLSNTSGDLSVNGGGPNGVVTMTFTTANWDTPQTVTVEAIDDGAAEGQELAVVNMDLAGGGTDCSAASGVVVLDNDVPEVAVTHTDGSTAVDEEGETTDTFTISLSLAPTSEVTVTVDPRDDPNQVTLNGGAEGAILTLTFGAGDTAAQTVTVAAINDSEAEGHPHTTSMAISLSQAGGNQAYDGFDVDDVVVSVSENDCGAGPFNATDYNQDCITDLTDYASFAATLGDCSITSVALCP